MLCSDTGHTEAIKIKMPVDLAKDISYWLEAIKQLGGNGRITLDISGGNVTSTEATIKRHRNKKVS